MCAIYIYIYVYLYIYIYIYIYIYMYIYIYSSQHHRLNYYPHIRCDEVKRYHSVSDAMSLAYACRGKPRAFFSVVEGSDDGKSLVVSPY